MNADEICRLLGDKFGASDITANLESLHPHAIVAASRWPEVARFLRDDDRLKLNLLRCITAIDMIGDDKLASVYDLQSLDGTQRDAEGLWLHRHEFAVRIEVDRNDPRIPSVADVWPAADWHEREAYDLMGIVYENHPDLTRILCPDDWDGHPLRKDYVFPMEYHGIPGTTEYELPNPKH